MQGAEQRIALGIHKLPLWFCTMILKAPKEGGSMVGKLTSGWSGRVIPSPLGLAAPAASTAKTQNHEWRRTESARRQALNGTGNGTQ